MSSSPRRIVAHRRSARPAESTTPSQARGFYGGELAARARGAECRCRQERERYRRNEQQQNGQRDRQRRVQTFCRAAGKWGAASAAGGDFVAPAVEFPLNQSAIGAFDIAPSLKNARFGHVSPTAPSCHRAHVALSPIDHQRFLTRHALYGLTDRPA